MSEEWSDGKGGGVLYLRTFGDLELFESREADIPLLRSVKPLLVPAVLATRPGLTATRDELADMIWQGADRQHAGASLRQALTHLRTYARGAGIAADNGLLRLDESRIAVDLWEFEAASRAGDHQGVVNRYRGSFLAGAERMAGRDLTNWIESIDAQTTSAMSAAYGALIKDLLQAGAIQEGLRHAQTFSRMNPLSEKAQLTLIHALRALGDDSAAIQVYEAYRSLLTAELEGHVPADVEDLLERLKAEATAPIEGTSIVYIVPPTVPHERSPSPWRRPWTWAAAVGVIALTRAVGWPGSAGPMDPIDVIVGAETASGERVDLAFRGKTALTTSRPPSGLNATDIISPDRTARLSSVPGEGGRDILLEDLVTGEQVVLVSTAADEVPMAWSPDGRKVLYRAGAAAADGTRYEVRPMVVDVETQLTRPLGDLVFPNDGLTAAWSQRGDRIALAFRVDRSTLGPKEGVYFTDPAGAAPTFVPLNEPHEGSWSPDGRQFAVVSGMPRSRDLFVVDSYNGWSRRVTSTPEDERTPVWLDLDRVAYVSEGISSPPELRLIDVRSGASVPQLAPVAVARLRNMEVTGPHARWIETLDLQPALQAVSPGQLLQLTAVGRDAWGHELSVDQASLTWSTSPKGAVHVLGTGWFRVEALGRLEIAAELGGWRSEALTTVSRPLELDASTPSLFEENWSTGLDLTRWVPFGDPPPEVRLAGGVDGGGVFLSMGDKSWASGAVTTMGFTLDQGLTVEVWGRAPFTDQLWQHLDFGLVTGLPPQGEVVDPWHAYNEFELVGVMVDGEKRIFRKLPRPEETEIPIPHDPSKWHLYALQVAADGRVSLVVDGQLHWQYSLDNTFPNFRPWDPSQTVFVSILGSSVNTEIMHGTVRVWQGERYVFERSGRLTPN